MKLILIVILTVMSSLVFGVNSNASDSDNHGGGGPKSNRGAGGN